MSNNRKIPITTEVAESLKTIPIASKTSSARSYHPSYRALSVVIDEGRPRAAVQTLPTFLISESGPLGHPDLYFRINNFDDAVATYGVPLAD